MAGLPDWSIKLPVIGFCSAASGSPADAHDCNSAGCSGQGLDELCIVQPLCLWQIQFPLDGHIVHQEVLNVFTVLQLQQV